MDVDAADVEQSKTDEDARRARAAAAIRHLRAVAILEGISFLVLLGIAMPLKYAAGMPLAVTVVGTIHGVLFLFYVAAVCRAGLLCRWPAWHWIANLVASVLPGGPFALDGRLRREQQALEAAAP